MNCSVFNREREKKREEKYLNKYKSLKTQEREINFFNI